MDLLQWSLNAIDTIFSTRSSGSEEPTCPAGTFAAGYTMDACLVALSVEDIEDIYLFGTLVTGILLFGVGTTLVYRKILEIGTAVRGPLTLPAMIDAMGRAVGTQTVTTNRNMENILEKLSALHRKVDHLGDHDGQRE